MTDPATAHHAPVGAEWLDRPAPIVRGIALRLSQRWGTHVAVVRTGFVVLCCAGGIGLVAYGAASLLPAVATQRPPTIRGDVGVVLIVAALVAAVTAMVPWLPTSLLWLITLAAMGAAVSAASGSQEPSDASLRGAPWRTGVGALLVLVGMGAALSGAGGIETLWRAVLIAVAVLGGMAMVVAPWLQRLIRSVEYERRERVRVEERADIAAHIHDSVLQTLTLIQNRAAEPPVVAALAHQQERELRSWLYGAKAGPDGTVRAAIEAAAAEVEDQYLVAVEAIVVGDGELTDRRRALVAAAREAMVNAAKFSGTNMVSVFAEVAESDTAVFVRDRGCGFDPDAVPTDRRGIADSIIGRVERVGGRAEIRSSPEGGTEIAITVPDVQSPLAAEYSVAESVAPDDTAASNDTVASDDTATESGQE